MATPAARPSGAATRSISGGTTGNLQGTSGNDEIWGWTKGNAVLAGGPGDDTYHVYQASDRVVEAAGGGTDTVVVSWRDWTLGANVENLVISNARNGTGNEMNNMLTGDGGSQTLDGRAGDDVLTGGGGADMFIAARGMGSDTIADFQVGLDKVRLDGTSIHTFGQLKAAAKQVGADTVISIGGGETLTLRGTQVGALREGDFWLPADPNHAGMTMTFREEFSAPLSASASGVGTTWKTTYGVNKQDRTLGSNKEAEYYSDASVGVNPFKVSDGVLDITAAPTNPATNSLGLPYTSGLITTAKTFAQTYGYFEARMELPSGQGFWPAFWLLRQDGKWPPEIDVVENLGHETTIAHTTVHTDETGKHTQTGFGVSVPNLQEGFHTFAVDWRPNTITWYIDGAMVSQAETPDDMHSPMYMLVNLAVGDAGSWPGKYDASTGTGHLLVDYVRAWQTNPAGSEPPAPVPGAPPSPVPVPPTPVPPVPVPPTPVPPVPAPGPSDVLDSVSETAAFGGVYTASPGADVLDFGRAKAGVKADASGFDAGISHTLRGSAFADEVRGGAAGSTVNASLGGGDDVFVFGAGASRVMGGAGNDVFAFAKGAFGKGDSIIDFHRAAPGGGEHDMLRLDGYSSDARLEWVSGTGASQVYRVVDGGRVSPTFALTMSDGSGARLGEADYVFTGRPPVLRDVSETASFGGTYTLSAGGDTLDFGRLKDGLRIDASGFDPKLSHKVYTGAGADEVWGGKAGTADLVVGLGAGNDVFHFGANMARVSGGAGNDVFVFEKGAIAKGDLIVDFRQGAAGGEHDMLRFEGFSASAHLDWVSTSGTVQRYHVVDGDYVSPDIAVAALNGPAHLTHLDYVFA